MDNLLKTVIEDSFEIGKFQANYSFEYRAQFFKLFDARNKLVAKNQKEDLKRFFSQVPLKEQRLMLPINCEYNVQLSQNKYLRQLLKEKYIKIVRKHRYSNKKLSCLVKV